MGTTISVIGLGRLGASMAAAIASRGFDVIGVDIDERTVEMLNAGEAPIEETGLAELVQANRARIRATVDHYVAVNDSDVSFVIVPTPSDESGAFSLRYAARAFREIGRALRSKASYHNVVLNSTVLPGSIRHGLLPILEAESGKTCGPDFGVCYGPVFVALGSVVHDFLNADFTLIGEFDERSGAQLEDIYRRIMVHSPPCRRMSLENAELTKVSLNAYVTMKISFANMIADLCERLPGGDVDAVTGALGADSRIGHEYLTGAIAYGGPCFPRDNRALAFLAKELGADPGLVETTDRLNGGLIERVVERLRPHIRHDATVAVLGLAYKPHTPVVEDSPGIHLVRALAREAARVVCHDPLARETARAALHDQAVILESLEECLRRADVVLIATPDPVYRRLTAESFQTNGEPVTVVDFWRILDGSLDDHPQIRYVPVGRGEVDAATALRLAALWRHAGGDVPQATAGQAPGAAFPPLRKASSQ